MLRTDAAEGAFAEFLERLRPGAEETRAARAAVADVAAALRRHFRPAATVVAREDHLVAGSFGKRTAIRPLPRLDLYYLLPAESCIGGPPPCAAALRETAVALAAAFRDVDVESWRILLPAVAVVPCAEHSGAFLIPGADGWRVSNPAAEAAALRLGDDLSGGRLGQLLALLKAWRHAVAAPVTPFALEVLAREFMAAAGPAPLPRLLSDCLAWSRRHTPATFELPGGLERLEIGADWHGPAEAAYWRCVLAERKAAAGETADALAEWRKVLGPGFARTTTMTEENP